MFYCELYCFIVHQSHSSQVYNMRACVSR